MPAFRSFEGYQNVERHHRNLPHWTAPGVTYFLTFRLGDAIPSSTVRKWEAEQNEFLRHFQVSSPQELGEKESLQYQKIFGRILHTTLDKGHGSCLFKKKNNREIVEKALQYFEGARYELGDFVIMPNHVHLLVVPFEEDALSNILHSWKSFTAKVINEAEGRTGKLWQDETYDHIVRAEAELKRIVTYIADNPSKAHLPESAFTHHSAEWIIEQ